MMKQMQQQQDSGVTSNSTPQHNNSSSGGGGNGNYGGESNRERSHTDVALFGYNRHPLNSANQSQQHHQLQHEGVPHDSTHHTFKQRLHELFTLIEHEMETLYFENRALRDRLERSEQPPTGAGDTNQARQTTTTTTMPNAEMGSITTTPTRRNFPFPILQNETSLRYQQQLSDGPERQKSSAKKATQSRQQKWKSAFINPSGKLALKVGANFPESKHRFVQTFKGHVDGVWHVCTAHFGSVYLLASASADQTSKIWLAEQPAQPVATYSGHSGSVNSVAIRAEGSSAYSAVYGSQLTILTCSGDRTAHIWRVNLEQILEKHRERTTANEAQERENEAVQQLVHQPLLKLTGHSDVITDGGWLFGGEQIITVSWDRTAKLFDAESGKILKVLSGHDQELTGCSSHPTQKLLATASRDFTFRLWDFREPIHSVAVFQGHNDAVTSVRFSTLHHIVSGSDDRTVKVWDLRNMRSPMAAIRLDSAANRIDICNTRNLLAIPMDNRNISVYDLNGNRQARIPRSTGKCHHRLVNACAWLCDHPVNNLISCGFDKQIIGWRVHLPAGAGTMPGGGAGKTG